LRDDDVMASGYEDGRQRDSELFGGSFPNERTGSSA
jgi:hypothetical protein